ncbi:hypothetical protein HK100_008654, partial [Physocladia obscura]
MPSDDSLYYSEFKTPKLYASVASDSPCKQAWLTYQQSKLSSGLNQNAELFLNVGGQQQQQQQLQLQLLQQLQLQHRQRKRRYWPTLGSMIHFSHKRIRGIDSRLDLSYYKNSNNGNNHNINNYGNNNVNDNDTDAEWLGAFTDDEEDDEELSSF